MLPQSQKSSTSIQGAALRLVLLVSCAHALVHLYELSLPSVEQEVAKTYFSDDKDGREFTGLLNNSWRFAFGFGALLAGWFVDRWGARTMLVVYLFGCGLACILAGFTLQKTLLFGVMFTMGAFASIYHPAGLALISRETNARTRTRALGLHGIFGSIGIGVAPLLAAVVMSSNVQATWQQYYWLLAGPGIALGVVFALRTVRPSETGRAGATATVGQPYNKSDEVAKSQQQLEDDAAEESANWPSYFTLIVVAALQGFVYSAMMSFLARYLTENMGFSGAQDPAVYGKVYAGGVLTLGCIGQYIAGRFAGPRRLEVWMALITAANAPFLVWMAYASGVWCAVAAGLFALIHFMHQPIYNSLIAKYTPARHRSLCYGLSFTMGFGVGSFGATFAGYCETYKVTYLSLGGIVIVAAILMGVLVWRNSMEEQSRN
ncbi:MAG: FSR family fosmidomycin resistance protein-like MFS transporter [Pirellulaceae bacterium]|jgi:FSR family fosmidomycin resistance protein-like MFS transporter